ncbi:MAG: hypothetical protein IKP86_03025 [Anaerolineaceae bacterium]|nr:hypothetical protein [Anaerolineaceae bacterium]
MDYSSEQSALIRENKTARIWLSGKAGCGKSTAAAGRVLHLLENAEGWPEVLIFTPGRNFSGPYQELYSSRGIRPRVTSYNSYIQSCLKLFWPLIAGKTAFGRKKNYPMFLTIEAAQIIMSKLIRSRRDEGYFAGLTSSPSRVFNQVMVAMHKCAAAEIPFDRYAEVMKESWGGDAALLPVFDQTQECGLLFRKICLENNLLDYSLQLETFTGYLLPDPVFRNWLKEQHIHFVFDNLEEEVPAAHHFVRDCADLFQSMLLITDTDGGYRSFMGCDPLSAGTLSDLCPVRMTFDQSFVSSPPIQAMEQVILDPKLVNRELPVSPRSAFSFASGHHYPEMIKKAVNDVANLVKLQGTAPKDIVILAPLVSDVLYTEMERGLWEQGIRVYLHRPSRPLLNERVTRSLLTLCELVRPVPGTQVRLLDIVQMAQCFIKGLDPMRGQLIVGGMFRERKHDDPDPIEYDIKPFELLSEEKRRRIPPAVAERFEKLRKWIELQRKNRDLSPDRIVSNFFTDVLIHEGFITDPETNLGIQKVADSMAKFRAVLDHFEENCAQDGFRPDWADYFHLVGLGMVNAKYYEELFAQPEDSVLISLSSAFLSMNRMVDYQIWLNVGAPRWWERFYGELTNDAVLSRFWPEGKRWDAMTAGTFNDSHMIRQVCGLLRRCRKQVRAYSSELNESGSEQKSKLLYLFSGLTRRFKFDKPTEPYPEVEFISELREEEAVYPGVSGEPPIEKLLRATGAVSFPYSEEGD